MLNMTERETTQFRIVKDNLERLFESRSEAHGTVSGDRFGETLEILRIAGKYGWAKNILDLRFMHGTIKIDLRDLLHEMETILREQGAGRKTYDFLRNNLMLLLTAANHSLEQMVAQEIPAFAE